MTLRKTWPNLAVFSKLLQVRNCGIRHLFASIGQQPLGHRLDSGAKSSGSKIEVPTFIYSQVLGLFYEQSRRAARRILDAPRYYIFRKVLAKQRCN